MQVSEVLSLEDETAIVSAWVEGSTLAELLLRHGALSEARSEIVVSSVLDGLAALHDAGVAHGSVSAENILVDDDDVTLIDFGLGSPTATDSGNQPTLFANDRANVGQLARLLLQNKAVNEPPQWRVAAIENAETGRFSGIDEMRSALLPSRRARLQLEREPSERPPLVLPFLVGLGVVFLTIGAFLLLGPDNDDQPAPTITGIEQDEQP
jgi:serine/threonine protein kinase